MLVLKPAPPPPSLKQGLTSRRLPRPEEGGVQACGLRACNAVAMAQQRWGCSTNILLNRYRVAYKTA